MVFVVCLVLAFFSQNDIVLMKRGRTDFCFFYFNFQQTEPSLGCIFQFENNFRGKGTYSLLWNKNKAF